MKGRPVMMMRSILVANVSSQKLPVKHLILFPVPFTLLKFLRSCKVCLAISSISLSNLCTVQCEINQFNMQLSGIGNRTLMY